MEKPSTAMATMIRAPDQQMIQESLQRCKVKWQWRLGARFFCRDSSWADDWVCAIYSTLNHHPFKCWFEIGKSTRILLNRFRSRGEICSCRITLKRFSFSCAEMIKLPSRVNISHFQSSWDEEFSFNSLVGYGLVHLEGVLNLPGWKIVDHRYYKHRFDRCAVVDPRIEVRFVNSSEWWFLRYCHPATALVRHLHFRYFLVI